MAVTVVFLKAGVTSWTVPAGLTALKVECLGPAGNGVAVNDTGTTKYGGGGGAYNYVNDYLPTLIFNGFSPGSSVHVRIGAGGSGLYTAFDFDNDGCVAREGGNATTSGKGLGGLASNGTGDDGANGGDGGDTQESSGGGMGGGGAGGPHGNGAPGGTFGNNSAAGSGGGGADGGSAGGNAVTTGAAGGNNRTGTGGGTAGVSVGGPGGGAGTAGGGGGAGLGIALGADGGAGGPGEAIWTQTSNGETAGPGGGGGGSSRAATGLGIGGGGGAYGGGGGGARTTAGPGRDGLIILTITGSTVYEQTLAITNAPNPKLTRAASHAFLVTNSSVSNISRSGAARLPVTNTPSLVMVRSVGHALLTTNNAAGRMIRTVAHSIIGFIASNVFMTRTASRALSVTNTLSPALSRMATHALPVTNPALPRFGPFTIGKTLRTGNTPVPIVLRALAMRALAVVNAAAGRIVALVTVRLGIAVAPAPSISRSALTNLRVPTAPIPSVRRTSFVTLLTRNPAIGTLQRALAVTVRALTAPIATLLTDLFQIPPACRIIIIPAKDRTILIECCSARVFSYPSRYVAEDEMYGAQWSADLRDGETIAGAWVTVTSGDIVVSDVQFSGSLVKFRVSGGSPIYQRLAIRVATNATPANTYQAEAVVPTLP